MSPAKLSEKLQEDFVRTELETGHRMLALAIQQRSSNDYEAAEQSMGLARVALSGAEEHLESVKIPQADEEKIMEDVRQLRNQIQAYDGGTTGGSVPTEKRKKG